MESAKGQRILEPAPPMSLTSPAATPADGSDALAAEAGEAAAHSPIGIFRQLCAAAIRIASAGGGAAAAAAAGGAPGPRVLAALEPEESEGGAAVLRALERDPSASAAKVPPQHYPFCNFARRHFELKEQS